VRHPGGPLIPSSPAEESLGVHRASFDPASFWMLAAYVAAVVALYWLVGHRYRVKHIDDAWTLSVAYNFFYKGISRDLVFENPWGGLGLFGKTYAWTYGGVLHLVGWSRENAYYLSTVVTWLAIGLWGWIIARLRFEPAVTLAVTALMLVTDPFFSAACQARVDALVFLMASLSFALFVAGRFFAAGAVAMVGMETHPMGLMALVYIAACAAAWPERLASSRRHLAAATASLGLGLAAGLGYYLVLHWEGLTGLGRVLARATAEDTSVNNYLYFYFLRTKYLRHVPELVMFVAALVVYWRKGWFRDNRFVGLFVVSVVLSTALVRRPNFLYAVYAYPAFLLLTAYVARRLGVLRALVGVTAGFLLLQYAAVGYRNRDFVFPTLVSELEAAVPGDGLPVFGSHNEWFALRDRDFLRFELIPLKMNVAAFYVIETDEVRASTTDADLRSACRLTPIRSFTHAGELYRVLKCDRRR
jgi:hypothetical protein